MIVTILNFITRLFVRPYRRKRPPSKKVAIVIPVSERNELTPDEKISHRHLLHYLGRYDKYLIAPKGVRFDIEGCEVKTFSRKFFGSAAAHGRLLYTPMFFKKFEDYDYIFFYHLDALAFSDELEDWCDKGLDYIGPPWLICEDKPWIKKERVGNGGFALIRVESILKVLYNRYREKPTTYWLDMFARDGRRLQPVIWLLEKLRRVFPRSKIIRRPLREWEAMENPERCMRQCDFFWADKAVDYLPEWRVGTLEEGLRFAFEAAPRLCFERNGGHMPFGCHAFASYDRAFFEPYLLAAKTEVSEERETAVGAS